MQREAGISWEASAGGDDRKNSGRRARLGGTSDCSGRAQFGRIASLSTGFLSGESDLSFVVLLDEGTTVVTCSEDRRGESVGFRAGGRLGVSPHFRGASAPTAAPVSHLPQPDAPHLGAFLCLPVKNASAAHARTPDTTTPCWRGSASPTSRNPAKTAHAWWPQRSRLWQRTSTRFWKTTADRFCSDRAPNACLFSGASMPANRTLCWVFAPSRTVIVSPSGTPWPSRLHSPAQALSRASERATARRKVRAAGLRERLSFIAAVGADAGAPN